MMSYCNLVILPQIGESQPRYRILCTMLEKIKNLLQPAQPEAEPPSIELAAAVLMLDIAIADDSIDADEVAGIRELLQVEFGMDATTLDACMEQAMQLLHDAVDMYAYARVVCQQLPVSQRARLLAGMWQVAMCDNNLHRHEEAQLRKLSDLLGLSHSEFIQAKHQADAAS